MPYKDKHGGTSLEITGQQTAKQRAIYHLICNILPLNLQGASTSTTESFGHRPKRPRVAGKCQDLPGNLMMPFLKGCFTLITDYFHCISLYEVSD